MPKREAENKCLDSASPASLVVGCFQLLSAATRQPNGTIKNKQRKEAA